MFVYMPDLADKVSKQNILEKTRRLKDGGNVYKEGLKEPNVYIHCMKNETFTTHSSLILQGSV